MTPITRDFMLGLGGVMLAAIAGLGMILLAIWTCG